MGHIDKDFLVIPNVLNTRHSILVWKIGQKNSVCFKFGMRVKNASTFTLNFFKFFGTTF